MPWVKVYWDKGLITDDALRDIVSVLPYAVADALDAPLEPNKVGELTHKDIEVKTEEFNDFDVYSKPLSIIITATDFPTRKENLDERCELIETAVKEVVPRGLHGFVWVTLVAGSFREF